MFCASFSVCSTVVDRCVFYLVHVVIIIPLSLPRHSFIFFSMCIFDIMFGQGTAKTIEVGRIVGAPTTVCGWKSIVLLFGGYCSIVLLSTRLLLVKYLLSGGLFSRHTRRQHTRLLFDSVGRCLDRQDCVYQYVVSRS